MGATKVEKITWHEITGDPLAMLPDMELGVLVFDGYLNDTVNASLSCDEAGRHVWLELVTDQPLQDPQWWCEVPFPGGVK